MLFALSKIVGWLVEPSVWILCLLVIALICLLRSHYRAARWIVALNVVLVIAVFQLPVGALLIRPLEHAVPAPAQLPAKIDGIILLGGILDPVLTRAYGMAQLRGDADRATEFMVLARRYPDAKLVFTGGSSRVAGEKLAEAGAMKHFLEGQGIDVKRILFEDQSRNTYENALYSKRLVQPVQGENWILITSAFHMPRSYGIFTKAGWTVLPYPVAYRARPVMSLEEGGYELFAIAVHEWVGVLAYRLLGRM